MFDYLTFDIFLTFHISLKPPQPITGIFFLGWAATHLVHVYGIKVRNEENVNQTANARISETIPDIKISNTYLESAPNFTSDVVL